MFVELPPEAGYGKEYVGELDKCMYGTRDAAQGWELTYSTALVESMGSGGVLHTLVYSATPIAG